MSTLRIGPEGKQIFIDCYNDSSIPWNQLNKAVTTKLQEKGFLDENTKLTAEFVRTVYEQKLNLQYKNRPKGQKVKLEIEFEDDTQTTTATVEEDNVVISEEETMEQPETMVDVTEEVKETVNQWQRQEPSKFEF